MEVYLHLLFCASTYNSCSTCQGGASCTNGCLTSNSYPAPGCGGSSSCTGYCFTASCSNDCKSSSCGGCVNYCSLITCGTICLALCSRSSCKGLATQIFCKKNSTPL